MTSNKYEVEFANRNGTPTKATIDAGTEFEARKSVSRRPDFGSIIACRKMSNYIERQPQVQYVIRSLSESDIELDGDAGAFWSNVDGWGSFQAATLFSTKERMSLNLPMSAKLDAEWMLEEEARDLEANRNLENPQERYRLSAMDEGNDHYSVLDTKTQLYWSSEGWQRPDSGWASVLTRSEAARKAYELNRKLSNYLESSNYTDPANMSPAWSNEHCEAAQREGWDIFDTHGSDGGPWQIQRFDDASEVPGAPQLKDDESAWRIVIQGTAAHHEAARQFIRTHSPQEWASMNQREVQGSVSNYTAGQNHEPLEHEMAEYVELEVTLRSKTTFGTDKESIRVWDGQSAKDVAERTAQGYGAEVVEIRNPDGSIYEEALKVEDSPSPGM